MLATTLKHGHGRPASRARQVLTTFKAINYAIAHPYFARGNGNGNGDSDGNGNTKTRRVTVNSSNWRVRFVSSKSQLSTARKSLARTVSTISAHEAVIATLQQDVNSARGDATRFEDVYVELSKNFVQTSSALAGLTAELKSSQERVERLLAHV